MTRDVTLALIGLGNVGRAFLDLLVRKEAVLAQRYGLRLSVVAAADSSGGVWDPVGLDPAALLAHKRSGRGAGAFPVVRGATVLPGGGVRLDPVELVRMAQADCVVEASPVNLRTGQPGLDCARAALGGGADLVLANKGPLVHAFAELEALAAANGRGLAYSATVCGALPVVNVGRRDLAACDIRRVRGIFNSTSNSILAAMARGESYDSALRAAQEAGIAEADPSLDVEGWDTANKLVIIANSVLRQPATLADVQPVEGIGGITPALMAAGQARSETVKLVATAERDPGGRYRLSVRPEWLPGDDFLAGVRGWEMGIVWDTDIMGLQQHKVDERGPIPTAAAVLRDVITLCGKAQ
jgi:homoserine dehydrogenase